jgi:excisionase family DNA binding protein
MLRIGERTAYDLVRQGRLPAIKVGNQWRIETQAFEEWLAAGGDRGPADADDDRGSEK